MAKNRQNQLVSVLLDFYHKPVARVSLELILSVIAVVFFAIFAIRPTLLTMSDLVKEIEDKKELDRQMDLKVASLRTAEEQYNLYQDNFYLLDQAIPRKFNLVQSLKMIEKIAGEDQLVINRIAVSDIPEPLSDRLISEQLGQLERSFILLNVEVIGDYLQIRRFVEKLISLRQLIIVDQVSFSKQTETGSLTAQMRLSLPYYTLAELDTTN